MKSALFLLTYYYPHWTGLTQYARILAEMMVKDGVEVSVLTTKHENHLKDKEVVAGVKVIREKPWVRVSRSLITPLISFKALLAANKYDSLVIFLPMAEAALLALIGKIFNKRVILIYNGDLILPRSGFTNRVIEYVYLITTRLSLYWCNKVIVNTSDYASHSPVLKDFKNKWVELVPPLSPLAQDKKQINNLKRVWGETVVGFAGRFVEEKGFDILLKAIPEVIKRNKKVRFVFAGETKMEYENFFEKNEAEINKLKNNLIILGKLNRSQMGNYYGACDLLVISSRSDFFPFVQAEAMLSGLPIVVTNIPGARWLVANSGMGVVVEKESHQALAYGIVQVLEEKDKFKRKLPVIKKIFDSKKLLKRYKEVIFQYA